MIDFSQATYQAILQDMLSKVPDTYDKRDGSPIPTALGPAAFVLEGFFLALNLVQQQAFVQTASGESLDMLGVIAGLTRYPASAAVRLGIFNQSVPIGSRFSTVNGSDSIDFTVTAASDTANQYQLTADTPGAIGNEYTGQILPITTIQGLTSATITSILVPGDDEETDDEFRARIITALNDRPFGGNIASYRENILAIDGVGGVQIYPTWNGGGTVKCSVIGADWLPASPELVESVQNAIDPPPNQGLGLGLAPIGATVTIVSPDSATIDIGATVALSAGYSVEQVQDPISEAIDAYLQTIRESWGTNTSTTEVVYASDIYIARITAAIVSVAGVVNATNVTINGESADLSLAENETTQQLPILGTVTLSE